MGKILKYCSSCDEGFADKFQFCPNCGDSLQAFEMNPVESQPKAPAKKAQPPKAAPPTREVVATPPPVPAFIESEPAIEPPPIKAVAPVEKPPVIHAAPEPEPVKPVVEKPASVPAAAAPVFYQTKAVDADAKPHSFEEAHSQAQKEGGYYLTVIEEKNVGTRNGLLLGAAVFMSLVLLTGLVVNIFSKDLDIGSIDDAMFNAVLVDDVPTTEEKKPEVQKKDNGGGGGGGGDNDPRPASQGERPPMRVNPEFAPSATSERLTNPTIPIQMAIKGPIDERIQNDGRYGVKLGALDPSNGGGTGGGIGNGRGGGVGNGIGGGYGPGSGGGMGGGNNGGIGGGDSDGGGPPPRAVGESAGLKIISKPKATFTNEARQANFTGTVMLRVTFNANGSIGGVSAIKGAPYGLTEQAIAAAHSIRFEPAKVNGVPTTVTKSVEYSFTLY